MTQKTIKALYKQPVNYKLTKDGYKTINGVIHAQDGMPKVVDLPVPSELYTTDLQYNVNTEVNGAPVITTEQFTLPDNEICEAKEYCYAPKGINYNYTTKQNVRYYDNFTVVGSPNINNNIVSRFSVNDRLQLVSMPTYPAGTITSFEFMFKIHTPETFTPNGRLLNDFNSYDDVKLEVSSTGIAFNYGTSSAYIYTTSTPISTNTDYWIRVIYNNGIMSLDYSTDGINYSVVASAEIASSNIQILSSTFDIGARYYGNQDPGCTWAGSIDLSETYIKINDEYYWLPYRDTIEDVTFQIPGILDSSVTTDNWQQSQEYKLYQLKNQNNTDSLQLTENSITDTTQKYKQYIDQITIPARDYKWYYNGIPQSQYANFWSHGAIIENEIGIDFTGGPIEVYPLNYMGYDSNIVTAIFNIETGDITTDCVFFNMYDNYEEEASILFAIRNSKFSYNTYVDPTQIVYGDTVLSSNTKYWVALSLNKIQMKLELYLIQDNNYNKEQLPDISLWLKQFVCNITNHETIYAYSYIGASTSSSVSIASFNGKVYLNNMFATRDLTTSYEYLCWESYSYSNFIYQWYANKSLYNYNINENYGNILDFSDSWVNVTNNWKTQKQYLNPEVFLMPTNGGEIINYYSANGILSGTAHVDELTGIMSNCNPTNYLTLPEAFLPENNSWEINLKVKTPSTTNEMHYIMGSLNSYYWTVGGELSANNAFGFGITSTGESWDIAWLAGTTVATSDTWYWIRLSFTGTEYKFELSTDGETYNLEASMANTTSIYQDSTNSIIHLGTQATHYTYWTGEIDLSQCNIKINNTVWWNGVNVTQANKYFITKEVSEALYTDLSTLPSTLLDNNNFIMSGKALASGPASHNIDGAKSFGYFTYTPTKNETIIIKAYVSSEGNYDYGACYIGTRLYNADRSQITGQVTDGNGSWLFLISGSTNETAYTKDLLKGVTYYIHFYYTKDGSASGGSDRVFITSLSGFSKKENVTISLPGCLYNYNDEGQEHQFDVYYDSNYTQPILVSAGESYSEGTKVDTITIPAHKTWNYQAGGNWLPITYVDTTTSNYTYEDGNLVLTEYTGNETDVTLPNAVL